MYISSYCITNELASIIWNNCETVIEGAMSRKFDETGKPDQAFLLLGLAHDCDENERELSTLYKLCMNIDPNSTSNTTTSE